MTPGMIHLDGVKKDPHCSAISTSQNLKSIMTIRLTVPFGKSSNVRSNALRAFSPAFQGMKHNVLKAGRSSAMSAIVRF